MLDETRTVRKEGENGKVGRRKENPKETELFSNECKLKL